MPLGHEWGNCVLLFLGLAALLTGRGVISVWHPEWHEPAAIFGVWPCWILGIVCAVALVMRNHRQGLRRMGRDRRRR
jgi:integral membrane sensor domain MASE1